MWPQGLSVRPGLDIILSHLSVREICRLLLTCRFSAAEALGWSSECNNGSQCTSTESFYCLHHLRNADFWKKRVEKKLDSTKSKQCLEQVENLFAQQYTAWRSLAFILENGTCSQCGSCPTELLTIHAIQPNYLSLLNPEVPCPKCNSIYYSSESYGQGEQSVASDAVLAMRNPSTCAAARVRLINVSVPRILLLHRVVDALPKSIPFGSLIPIFNRAKDGWSMHTLSHRLSDGAVMPTILRISLRPVKRGRGLSDFVELAILIVRPWIGNLNRDDIDEEIVPQSETIHIFSVKEGQEMISAELTRRTALIFRPKSGLYVGLSEEGEIALSIDSELRRATLGAKFCRDMNFCGGKNPSAPASDHVDMCVNALTVWAPYWAQNYSYFHPKCRFREAKLRQQSLDLQLARILGKKLDQVAGETTGNGNNAPEEREGEVEQYPTSAPSPSHDLYKATRSTGLQMFLEGEAADRLDWETWSDLSPEWQGAANSGVSLEHSPKHNWNLTRRILSYNQTCGAPSYAYLTDHSSWYEEG